MFEFHWATVGPLAYLDGGTGSMLLQAALAGLLSSAYVIKTRWMELRRFVVARSERNRSK
jgi:hypothetical protein